MDLEAVVLQGPVYLLLSGVKEVYSDAPREKSGNQPQVLNALNDSFCLGSGWRGNNLSQACVFLQGSPKGGYRGSGAPEDQGQGPLPTPPGDLRRGAHRKELS